MIRICVSVCILICSLMPAALGYTAQGAKIAGISRVGFSIQVGAFAEVKNAERLAAKLHAKGIDAFYFRKESGVYAVRFGDYPTREAARQDVRKLLDEKLIGAYFIAAPQETYVAKPKEPVIRSQESLPRKTTPAGVDMGGIAARTAERFVGIPYQWGGNTVVDGMDCSGFVRAVYNLCGVNIPRTSREQFRVGEKVDKTDLKDGDLVFFGASEEAISHVGIYVGNGRFVHAPRRGDEIKVSTLGEPYFAKEFIGAKRYF